MNQSDLQAHYSEVGKTIWEVKGDIAEFHKWLEQEKQKAVYEALLEVRNIYGSEVFDIRMLRHLRDRLAELEPKEGEQ